MQSQKTPYTIEILRSHRRTLGLEITRDGRILVRAPYRLPDREIQSFIEKKAAWLEKQLRLFEERQAAAEEGLSEDEIRKLAEQALRVIPGRVAYFADFMNVSYGRVTVRCQKTRWGSCSQKGNLNFNCLLMLAPPEVLDYVVVHELCHRKEMNHSASFWAEVEKVLPDYKIRRRWLKENGGALISKIL